MPETLPIQNVTIMQLDSGENFQSPENPLAYCSSVSQDSVNVTVIAPFHNNANLNANPQITGSVGADGNDVLIIPSYDQSVPLSKTYTQVAKISFTLYDVAVSSNGQATINITVDEEGLPDDNTDRLGDPRRKTVIIANGGG